MTHVPGIPDVKVARVAHFKEMSSEEKHQIDQRNLIGFHRLHDFMIKAANDTLGCHART